MVSGPRAVAGRARPPAGDGGYTLVALVVMASVMTILVAVALPAWTHVVQRDKEAELVFRGLQYAEAIRVFQLRYGRYPVRLEELVETRPRSIRQLWKDPMTEKGDWGLIFAQQAGQQGRSNRRGTQAVAPEQAPAAGDTGLTSAEPQDLVAGSGPGGRRGGRRVTTGPVIGVHSKSQEQSKRTFFGAQRYDQWQFTANLIPAALVVPGTLNVPRANSDVLGRPFAEGLSPEQGGLPGQELGQGQAPGQAGAQPRNPQQQQPNTRQRGRGRGRGRG